MLKSNFKWIKLKTYDTIDLKFDVKESKHWRDAHQFNNTPVEVSEKEKVKRLQKLSTKTMKWEKSWKTIHGIE